MAKTVNSYTMIEMAEWREGNETHDLEEPFDENFWLTVRSEARSTCSQLGQKTANTCKTDG